MTLLRTSLYAAAFASLSPVAAMSQAPIPMNAAITGPLAAAPDRFVRVGDMSLRYRDVGRGDAIVLVHGWARTSNDWASVAESLATTQRVIAMDVRGFGKSSKSGDSAKYGTELADDVVRLMDHLGIRRAHLVGQSMGALVVANVASRYAARVTSVTMIGGPFGNPRPPEEKMAIDDLRSGKGLIRFLQPGLVGADPAMVAGMSAQIVATNDVPSLIASMSSLLSLDITNGQAPAVPALVICGERDSLLPASRRMAGWWPKSHFVEIPGATHILLARPEVAAAMHSFIGSTP